LKSQAYQDRPLNIGSGQTISQPYIVALMDELLGLKGDERVLEIGTGCGYQTAILAQLAAEVYSIERIKALALKAIRRLKALGIRNVVIRVGDGTLGWAEKAPFDVITVAAATPEIPAPFLEQVKEGGRLVIPHGTGGVQSLMLLEKRSGRWITLKESPCRFVKLIGKYGW
jgi:protein-L-isoaspartate(D-aspartate) O-methyltransferase